MKLLRRLRPDGLTALTVTCTALLAVGITSIATGAAGDFVRIGKRNAAPGTTAIVGSTTGFSTRQSNNTDGDGGAASVQSVSSQADPVQPEPAQPETADPNATATDIRAVPGQAGQGGEAT